VSQHQAEIEKVQVEIREIQDDVFEPFCEAYDFDNVREYEARRFRHDAQEMEGRAAFNTQKAKLSSMIEFEKRQLGESQERMKKLEVNVAKEKEQVKQLETDLVQQSELEQELTDQIEQLTAKMQEYRGRVTEKAEASNEAKNASRKFVKEIDGQTKLISTKEAQVDRLGSEKLGLLKQCQLEQIDISMLDGQELQNISFEVLFLKFDFTNRNLRMMIWTKRRVMLKLLRIRPSSWLTSRLIFRD
jgi:structural maintenance of chromosome 1